MAVKQLDCVIAPPDNSGITNHVELRISQNQIDIYATDAGVAPSPANLRRIAVVTDANLSLTRGLIWLEDVHYNADKGESGPNAPSQKQHTFVWDNVAFDGPFTYRDFSYDALDVNQPNAATKTVDLGKAFSAQSDRKLECSQYAGKSEGRSRARPFQFLPANPGFQSAQCDREWSCTLDALAISGQLRDIRGVPMP